MSFIVTEKAQRPSKMDGTCFYCGRKIGNPHGNNCPLIRKTVTVRMTVDYEINVPSDWDKDMIEFHRNESGWCSNNAIAELEKLREKLECLCDVIEYRCLSDEGELFLAEE